MEGVELKDVLGLKIWEVEGRESSTDESTSAGTGISSTIMGTSAAVVESSAAVVESSGAIAELSAAGAGLQQL